MHHFYFFLEMKNFINCKLYIFSVSLIFLLFPSIVYGLTPIARWDVVPYQRIEAGQTFNIGVVAFSKARIDRVQFTVSGQGYSGQNPLQSNSMTYNPRTNVYEYWVPLHASDFATNGTFTVQAVVYGKDGGSRTLESLSLKVNATGNLTQPKAWVSTAGNDATGAVNNSSLPFRTVGNAVKAIQAANGGNSDGGIVYFYEGRYTLGSGTTSTTSEWVTFARDPNAAKENTIIEEGGTVTGTNLLKFKGLTLVSTESGDTVAPGATTIWVDDCRLIGAGRYISSSNPVFDSGTTPNYYYTNTYIYDSDYGIHRGVLARGVTVQQVGNDPFVNTLCVINARVDDVDPGSTYWHADGYQSWGDGPQNRIIYNYYGTNLHYQGLFLREENNTPGNDNAFVNIFMEMRKPGRPGSSGGPVILTNGAIYGVWDHLLVWHCTFPTSYFAINPESIGSKFTNSSFIGNVFYEYRENVLKMGPDPSYAMPGNVEKNDFLYNHFIWSCVDQGGCSSSEPQYYSKSPDSASAISQSVGDPKIDLTDPSSNTFGMPLDESVLINRVPFATVPADALGNLRDQNPDTGALEGTSLSPTNNLSTPAGFQMN